MSEIKVPDLGESITEGTISNWLKEEGDAISEGDIVVELETDKVNLEINAESSGTLQKIMKQTGDTVEVGEVIAILGESEQADSEENEGKEKATDTSVKAADHPPAESPAAATQEPAEPVATRSSMHQEERKEEEHTFASPAARKLAREKGINIRDVQTQDPLGRVTPEDIKAHTERPPAKKQPDPSAMPASKSASSKQESPFPTVDDAHKPVERVRMSRRRQTIAKRLVEAQHNAAMLTTFNEVDMSAILDVRRRRKEAFKEKHDIGLGFMSFFTKAVIGGLKEFPRLNAEIQGEEMLLKKYYDIGIAVAAKEGLVVPVIRDADRKNFAELEHDVAGLAEKARTNSLKLDELQGGTFTITNGGIFGSLLSTPILNTPQVGILGMHTIQKRPVATSDDKMENRPMMYIALSYDHRIVDGKEAVQFLVKVKQLLEDPETLLIEG